MKNNHKKTLTILALIFSFVFFIGGLGFTTAWFTDSKQSTGSATYGKVQLGSGTTATAATAVTNAVPGDVLISGPFKVVKETNSAPIFVRAQIALTTAATGDVKTWVDGVNAAINATLTPATGTGYKWVKSGDYYYLTNTSGAPLSVTGTTEYSFLTGDITIPLTTTQMASYGQYGATMSASVTFQAIQSENVGTTVDAIKVLNWAA